MRLIGSLKHVGMEILKGVAAALISFIGLVLGGMVTAALGLPRTAMPMQADLKTLVPLMLLSGILIAILLGECFRRLYSRYWHRFVSILLCTYLLYYLLNTLDGLLFSPLPNMSTSIVSDLFPALFAAAAIALLWRPNPEALRPEGGPRTYLSFWKPWELAWRLALAWLIFPPLYYLVGRGAAIFTLPYYLDPNLGLGLTLPSLGTMMAMQVLRGALFLLAVVPILVAWRGSRNGLWLWIGADIFGQIAATVILQGYWLPAGLRIPHSLELLVDSVIQAYFYALLLARPSSLVIEPGTLGALSSQHPEVG